MNNTNTDVTANTAAQTASPHSNKIYINADDMIFNETGDKEISIIGKARNKILMSGFKRRAAASVAVGILLAVGEYVGRLNSSANNFSTGVFVFILVAVLVFNALSFGYIVLKRRMDLYTDKMEVLYCTVAEKYSQHKLSNENKKHSQNYVLLESDKYHCTTAFAIKDSGAFNKISVGDVVLLLKTSPYGDVHYEVFTEI
jgi:hypothetical protein